MCGGGDIHHGGGGDIHHVGGRAGTEPPTPPPNWDHGFWIRDQRDATEDSFGKHGSMTRCQPWPECFKNRRHLLNKIGLGGQQASKMGKKKK